MSFRERLSRLLQQQEAQKSLQKDLKRQEQLGLEKSFLRIMESVNAKIEELEPYANELKTMKAARLKRYRCDEPPVITVDESLKYKKCPITF